MKTVYLAGPITGCTYKGCTDWRQFARGSLRDAAIEGLDPMRGKEYLANEESVGDSYPSEILSCSRGIMARDHWDCLRCDILLVNFLGATRVSIGTCMEIAWAWDNGIPVVAVMEQGNIHDHAMINEAIGFKVQTLEDAISTIKAIL